eukprot:1844715-Amphidinium_carterae.7
MRMRISLSQKRKTGAKRQHLTADEQTATAPDPTEGVSAQGSGETKSDEAAEQQAVFRRLIKVMHGLKVVPQGSMFVLRMNSPGDPAAA